MQCRPAGRVTLDRSDVDGIFGPVRNLELLTPQGES
jgi:hypothetical protein